MTAYRSFSLSLALLLLVSLGCNNSTAGIAVVTVNGKASLVMTESFLFSASTKNATDSSYVWRSGNPLVASVDQTGTVLAVSTGSTTIYAMGGTSLMEGGYPVVVAPDLTSGAPFLAEWKSSAHADTTAEAFRHWDGDGAIPASCARCHSTPGFRDFLGDDGSTVGIVDAAAPLGTTVECDACHNPKSLALKSVTFPSGVTVPNLVAEDPLGREAVCMSCHQGRESADSVDAAIAAIGPATDDEILPDRGFINVHYFPAAATRYGGSVRGGYLYEDKSYDVLFRHVPEVTVCQDCHDPHTLKIKLDTCAQCHNVTTMEDLRDIRMMSSLTRDYDGDSNRVEGIYFEIEGLRGKLLAAIQSYAKNNQGLPIIYDGHSYPYWFKDTNGNGVADPGEVSFPNQFKTFSARLLRATFNYQYATKDPGAFAHNAKFVIQLLHDSIEDLNAALAMADKVDMVGAVRDDVGHFNGTAEAFRHWDEDGDVSASCSRCHSGSNGYTEYLTYGATTHQPIANGMDCATCHTNFDDFDTRRIDQVTFPSGRMTPRIDTSVPTNDGLVMSNMCATCHQGRESKTSIDTAIDAWLAAGMPSSGTGSLRFKNVHYLAAAGDLYGTEAQVAYEYDEGTDWTPGTAYAMNDRVDNDGRVYRCVVAGTSGPNIGAGPKGPGLSIVDGTARWSTWYSGKFPHAAPGSSTNNCTFCHDPVRTQHTFKPNDNIGECKRCHQDNISGGGMIGLTDVIQIRLDRDFDYDGDGKFPGSLMGTESLHDEVQGLAVKLLAAIESYANMKGTPITYSPDRYPYFLNPATLKGFTGWDDVLLRASQNYQQSQKEPGAWAHNIDYVAQVIYDSIESLDPSLLPASGRAPVKY